MPDPQPSFRPIIVGIAGGSGSGKTTVMRRIADALGPDFVAILDHDAYYRDLSHVSMETRVQTNFDHPASLETDLLCTHLEALLAGRTIRKPVYDYSTHCRTTATTEIAPRPVILVEGILVLAAAALVDLMDLRIFVKADDDVRLTRRLRRDIVERGRSVEMVLSQYERTVRPMYLEFVEPSIRNADLIVPRGGHNVAAVDVLIGHLRERVART